MGDDIVLRDDNIPPIQDELFKLYSQGFVTDITLTCEDGKIFEAHKVILSARSSYFYNLIPKLKGDPVIFLKGIKGAYLEKILKYVYSGSAVVPKTQLRQVFDVARSLHIRGLLELAASELSRCSGSGFGSPGGSRGTTTTASSLSPVGSGKSDTLDGSRYNSSSKVTREARETALQQQKKLYDKYSTSGSAAYKSKVSLGRTSSHPTEDGSSLHLKKGSSSRLGPASKSKDNNSKHDNAEEETFNFKYKHISDDSDDMAANDNGNNESDFGGYSATAAAGRTGRTGADSNKYSFSKRRRGRPPKVTEDRPAAAAALRKDSKSSSDDDDDDSDSSDDDEDDDDDDDPSKKDDISGSSDSDSESDNSDLDSEESGPSLTQSPRRLPTSGTKSSAATAAGSQNKEPSPSLDDYFDIPSKTNSPQRRSSRAAGLNGQQTLTVQCKGKRAELHLSKFCNGSKGKSIYFRSQWLTPDDYEKVCGVKTKKYLESITTDYGPLKTLSVSGFLKLHTKKCKCNTCNEEDSDVSDPSRKGRKQTEREVPANNKVNNSVNPVKPTGVENNGDTLERGDKGVTSKRKKETAVVDSIKKPRTQKDEPSQLSEKPGAKPAGPTDKLEIKTDPSPGGATNPPTPAGGTREQQNKPAVFLSPPKMSSPTVGGGVGKTEILSPPTLTTTKQTLTGPIASTANNTITTTQQSSFSPSSTDSLSSPTFMSLSSSPQISPITSSSFGSSIIPNPSKLTGIPSPQATSNILPRQLPPTAVGTGNYIATAHLPNILVSSSSNTISQAKMMTKPIASQPAVMKQPQFAFQMGPPKVDSSTIMTTGIGGLSVAVAQHQAQYPMQRSRLGAVMQVRCKAVSAYLYVNKYESGSKGKCIQLGEEWLTPNEFEEKSGSKAKKYLSSIKCLGRPLRAYVNSGELRGVGPPPSPKPAPRVTKPKPPQPIAPAPHSGQNNQMGAMGQINMGPPGMSQAHMQQSLTPVAMMGSVSVAGGQPILINQSNFSVAAANSLTNSTTMHQAQNNMGGTPILTPMTFTLAPMSATTGLEVRQGMGGMPHQMQHGGGQHL